jgi:hypothetical protein
MTTTINASTSSGLVNTADTSGILQLQTASTAALTIDVSQNVGIGTASPTQKLQVAGNAFISAGQYFMWDNAGAWALQSDASTYVRTLINGNEQLRTNAYGIGIGGTTPSSGTGVTFPATQNASSDANTLDDYEEGTFTPTLSSSGSLASFTYVTQNANYVKIGRTVYFCLELQISSLAGGSSGDLRVSNLPFTVSTTPGYGAVSIAYIYQSGGTAPNGAMVRNGQVFITLYNNSGGSVTQVGFGSLTAFDYYIAGTYTASA